MYHLFNYCSNLYIHYTTILYCLFLLTGYGRGRERKNKKIIFVGNNEKKSKKKKKKVLFDLWVSQIVLLLQS